MGCGIRASNMICEGIFFANMTPTTSLVEFEALSLLLLPARYELILFFEKALDYDVDLYQIMTKQKPDVHIMWI